ncbi:class I SAM-dependent methyltransferase [Chitinophaga sp. Hz27]|uniref:class I SAM-dependent methyltransferase n=1 Tax=Chitinophaga sp. Hz27 TaxID=3347169 RepID=UPI0035E300A2
MLAFPSYSSFKTKMKLFWNTGFRYKCPFCGYTSRNFDLMGSNSKVLIEKEVVGGQRRRARCYKCGSSDRERLLYAFFQYERDYLSKNNKKRILHIAPEKNLSREFLSADLDGYICGDKFTFGYNYPAHVRYVDVLELDFPENHFDLVICNHVLEHIPDDSTAMKQIYRVLKPGGEAVLQVPISANSASTLEDFAVVSDEGRKELFGQEDHVRIYGQDYVQKLSAVRFNVKRINIYEKHTRFGINPLEDLFIAQKIV